MQFGNCPETIYIYDLSKCSSSAPKARCSPQYLRLFLEAEQLYHDMAVNSFRQFLKNQKGQPMYNRENLYKMIANNIRRERERLHITQAELAGRADLSVDTVKSIEQGRRLMSLDTYLGIVQALETSPYALMNRGHTEQYIERFSFMVDHRSKNEIEFILHMVEQLLNGRDYYLNG